MGDRKKIIVIDDDEHLVAFLAGLLKDNGYDPIAAYDGQEGLEKTKAEQPDLILLDITMPEKSGVKFYRQVRDDPDLKTIPVVIVTGISKDFEKFISTRRQVTPPDAYFSKPVDNKELMDTISRLLSTA